MRGTRGFLKAVGLCAGIFLISSSAIADHCGEDYLCHEALVKFSKSATSEEIQKVFSTLEAVPLQYFEKSRIYHLRFLTPEDTLRQIQTLRNANKVLMAAPNSKVTAKLLPNDPRFSELWGLRNTGQFGSGTGVDIGMENVWDYFRDCSSIIVAVIDSGIDYTHPDLSANMWTNTGEIPGNGIDDDGNGYVDDVYGYDFFNGDSDPMDDFFHGTHVAGTIGAVGNNGGGVTGVCQKAKIMAVKFLGEGGWGWYSGGIAAIEYALANGAKVLNNSWAGSFNDSGLQSAVAASDTAGAVFVAAAGNEGADLEIFPVYPASYDSANVVSVAATTYDDSLASFSNYGSISVDLGAPGDMILSTLPTWYYGGNDDYGYLSGTSMATPHTAGAAALLWAAYPNLTHRQVINLLFQGVIPKSYLSGKSVTGGMLNLANSFILADPSLNHPPVANAGSTLYHKVGETVTLQGSAIDEDGNTDLTYLWTLTPPAGSAAVLSDADTLTPSFLADVEGNYDVTLQVSDWVSTSVPSNVRIVVTKETIVEEPPPNVVIRAQKDSPGASPQDLGQGSLVEVGATISLQAGDSTQNNVAANSLVYEWSFVEKPNGSLSTLSSSSQPSTSFSPDKKGTYTVQLTVDNGHNENAGEMSFVAVESFVSNPDGPPLEAGAGGCSLQGGSPPASSLILIFGALWGVGFYRFEFKRNGGSRIPRGRRRFGFR